MSNDLIQKNAELGRFLFCERYTLQPVKNALYIAEGQDLKRGAVVDVNGVLVGTNSLMPYAVLENDCDTRAKGAYASVFVKGEFNFDKLSFADGLSKEDIDNIVYNGNGTGLVFKPYTYDSDFAPKSDDYKEISYIKQILTNPLGLLANTFRCKFDEGYTPTMGTSQTIVDSDENVWDIRFTTASQLFLGNTKLLKVIGANTSLVTDMYSLFSGCTNLTSVSLFDTSSVTNMYFMFRDCTSLTSVPLFDTSSVTSMRSMFYGCSSLKNVPLFDTSSVTNSRTMFYGCTSLESVPLFDTSSVTDMYFMFNNCTNLKNVPLFNTSSVNDMSSMFRACASLTSVPLFDTSSVTNMNSMFRGCTRFVNIPLFDTSSVTDMSDMFNGCVAVNGGALALYEQASAQANPPSSHANTFYNCGINTDTGYAELAQIPTSWGGLAA